MRIILLSLLLVAGTSLYATVDTLNLKACINYALENNHDRKIASDDIARTGWKIKEIRSIGLPQINAGVDYQYYTSLPTSMLPGEMLGGTPGTTVPVQFGQPHNSTAKVGVSQLLYSQSFITALKAASTMVEFYQIMLQRTTEEIVFDVAVQYCQTLNTSNYIITLSENEQYLQELKKNLEIAVAQDFSTKTDLNRVSVNLANVQTQQTILKSNLEAQYMLLKLLMGYSNTEPIAIQSIDVSPEELALNKYAFNTKDIVEYQLLEKQKELVEFDKKSISGEYVPTVSAYYNYQQQAQMPEFSGISNPDNWNETSLGGVQLTIPIFDGLNKRSRIKQKEIELKQLDTQLEQTQLQLYVVWQSALIEKENALISVINQQQNSVLAEEIYQNSNLSYQQGFISLTDLMNAELEWKLSKQLMYEQELKLQIAELKLLKTSGKIMTLLY